MSPRGDVGSGADRYRRSTRDGFREAKPIVFNRKGTILPGGTDQ